MAKLHVTTCIKFSHCWNKVCQHMLLRRRKWYMWLGTMVSSVVSVHSRLAPRQENCDQSPWCNKLLTSSRPKSREQGSPEKKDPGIWDCSQGHTLLTHFCQKPLSDIQFSYALVSILILNSGAYFTENNRADNKNISYFTEHIIYAQSSSKHLTFHLRKGFKILQFIKEETEIKRGQFVHHSTASKMDGCSLWNIYCFMFKW